MRGTGYNTNLQGREGVGRADGDVEEGEAGEAEEDGRMAGRPARRRRPTRCAAAGASAA